MHALNRCWARLAPAFTLAALGGCAGNGEGLDQNGRPPTPGTAGTALTADFNSIQDNVFTPVCTRCHAGATTPRGLRLDAGNSYALLVGVASSEVPALQRVRPGDPAASYLIQKLTGTAAVGGRMPLGGPYLPDTTINAISQWIRNGAPRPASVGGVQKPGFGLQVATTAPLDGDLIDSPVAQVVIAFDRELDANLVNVSTVSLVDLDREVAIAAHLQVPIVNPEVLLVTPNAPLQRGHYRVTLRGSGGGALAGLDSQPLLSAGGAGRDFTLTFTVE